MSCVNNRGRNVPASLGSTSRYAVNKPELLSRMSKWPDLEPIWGLSTGNLIDSCKIGRSAEAGLPGGPESVTPILQPSPDELGRKACLLAGAHRSQELLGEFATDSAGHILRRRPFADSRPCPCQRVPEHSLRQARRAGVLIALPQFDFSRIAIDCGPPSPLPTPLAHRGLPHAERQGANRSGDPTGA